MVFITIWTSKPPVFNRGRHLFETRHSLEVLRQTECKLQNSQPQLLYATTIQHLTQM